MTVLFHGHFALNRNYMSCILNPALDQSGVKDKQLARPFGYSAPFAAHYRSWLHKTGVIELGFPVTLTAMGAVVMDGAVIGEQAVVAAGAVVLAETVVPDHTLWAGVPAKQRGAVKAELSQHLAATSARYVEYSKWFNPEQS